MAPPAGASDHPLSRALRALELVHTRPGITAAMLGEQLQVSPRAVRRYIGALRDAGIGVESTPGPGGGYQLTRGGRAPLLLTQPELLALVMALLQAPSLHHGQTSRQVVYKLLAALPARLAGQALTLLDSTATVPDGWSTVPDAQIVLDLVSAIDNHERVRLAYRSAADRDRAPGNDAEATANTSTERTVEPWSVVVRHGRWYLLCHNLASNQTRSYRIDRITTVTPTGQHFEPPKHVDGAALLEQHLRTSWTHPVQVLLHASEPVVGRWLPTSMGTIKPRADGTCVLTGRTNNPRSYALDLARTPLRFEVIEGEALRQALTELSEQLRSALG